MEHTFIEVKIFNDTISALAAKVADGDLAAEKREEAQQELNHLINDFVFDAGPNHDQVMPKLARRIRDEFFFPVF